jgi:hypothetical protein
MSVTSIQFIGLFIVMMNSGAGLHILLPHFPGTPYANHVSVIQYSPAQVSSATWPGVTACGPDNSLRCAPVSMETITFAGATDPTPQDIIGDIPHLRCCCSSMTDILPKYKDPTATGKLSAHILVGQGVAEAITGTDGRTDTWLTMHSVDPIGITVTANPGTGGSYNIVFKPGAVFTIQNSISPTTGSNHFLAYYLMGVGSGSCTSVPSDGPPCARRSTECAVLKTAPAKKVTLTPMRRPVRTKVRVGSTLIMESLDSDCSNSHWP